MLIFFFICALMVLLALFLTLPPLFEAEASSDADETRTTNLLVYKDQLRELEADLRNGLLSEDQYQQDKDELERRLLEDVGESNASRKPARRSAPRKLGYAIAVAIPVAAIAFYLIVGNPKSIDSRSFSSPAANSR